MYKRYRTLYAPYGAPELKRVYQRNQTIGNLTVIVLVSLSLGFSLLWPDTSAVGEPVGPDDNDSLQAPPIAQSFEWNENYRIIRERQPRRSNPSDRGIPVAIPDSLFLETAQHMDATPAPVSTDGPLTGGPEFGMPIGETGGDGAAVYTPEAGEFVLLERQPEMIRECKPDYPRLAKDAGLEGDVWLRVLLDIDGSVMKAEAAVTSGVSVLDEAAVSAAGCCTFSPGIQNGRPVRVWITYRVSFVLSR